jgi:hypothetical protein
MKVRIRAGLILRHDRHDVIEDCALSRSKPRRCSDRASLSSGVEAMTSVTQATVVHLTFSV